MPKYLIRETVLLARENRINTVRFVSYLQGQQALRPIAVASQAAVLRASILELDASRTLVAPVAGVNPATK